MLTNYLKITFRNLLNNKGYSAINIGGLAAGMAVAMLIGLWIYDEFSYNRYHENYDRIGRVMQRGTFEGVTYTGEYMPAPVGDELRTKYGADFKHVVMASWIDDHILAFGDKKFTKKGTYLSEEAPDMFSLRMLKGTRAGLKDQASIMLSASTANALFGSENPIDKIVKMDNKDNVRVTGVYEDLPFNAELRDLTFIAPWNLYLANNDWVREAIQKKDWNNSSWQVFAQISPNSDFETVSRKISNMRVEHTPEAVFFKPKNFLLPMSDWHLYSSWDKSGNQDGRIQYVWLFAIIGVFVLLLASINFMNLSTARSEKRAREVGVRKAIGSMRSQLIGQFLSESLTVVALAFVIAILLVIILLPAFNEIADKKMSFPWGNPVFWGAGVAFCLITGIISGSYPALYLSSFQPVRVLKGALSLGKFASVPRKVLVVLQFTVSVTLVIGTILVYKQIRFAKDRLIGYDRSSLITVAMNTPELYSHYNALRASLLETGAVREMSTSSTPPTETLSSNDGFKWQGKDPNMKEILGTIAVTHDFGKTVGWQFIAGRDFSRQFSTDSSGMVLNEAAVKYMGFKSPADIVGQTVNWRGQDYNVVGVIRDMLMGSPFEPVFQTVYMLNYGWAGIINIKLKPEMNASKAISAVEGVFKKFNPGSPFDFKFTDQQYALKFAAEERIAKLAAIFASLAIMISCLGLFGLASFTAEQRKKEIGVRKVLGASVANLWAMLSRDFVVLVVVASVIAIPIAYYFLNGWLQKYEYHTKISWWVFAVSGAGAMLITLLTVSYQAIRAALMNPVKSLKTE